MIKRITVCGILLVPMLAVGCATYEKPDWSKYDGPGREYFLKEEVEFPLVPDPGEPTNKVISGFNHFMMTGVVQPVSWIYRTILPSFARTGIGNAFDNALYPVRLVTNLLQGKGGGAWRETQRFGVNTTYGVLGLWDQATELEIEPSKEDFGQTFGYWGWRNSTYIVLPILGPSTYRDGLGLLGDALSDPLTYFFPATMVRGGSKLLQGYPRYRRFIETNFDPYELGRILFVLNRDLRIDDYQYEAPIDETGKTETLEAVFLTYEDNRFPRRGRTHRVHLPHTGKELAYTVWLQDEPAELTYFIPGTGGHRLGNSSLAVAEVIFKNGRSAVTISNSLNFEFIESGSTTKLPGVLPVDAHDVHMALDAIDKDLEKRYPGRITKRRLAGISLGASHALFIAAATEDPENKLIKFQHYVSLNAPVSFEHAVNKLDAFYNYPLRFQEGEERDRMIEALLRKVLFLAEDNDLQPGNPLPFAEGEAKFLIGLSFRKTMGDIVFQTQKRKDQGRIKNQPGTLRNALTFREAREYSFMEYIYAFVLPYFAKKRDDITYDEAGVRRLFELSDLHSIADALKDNDRISFFSNRNDFLLRPEDIKWVQGLLGDRAYFFDRGGHLGNLWREDVQQAIQEKIQSDIDGSKQ